MSPGIKASRLFKFADSRSKWLLIISIIGNLGSGAAYPIFLYLFGQLANSMTGAKAAFHWSVYIALMAITATADFFFAGAGAGCAELAAERQQRSLRARFLDELLRQEMAYFDEQDATTLGTQLAWNSRIIRSATGQRFGLLFLYIGFTIAAVIFSLTESPSMTLISLIPVPFILLSGVWSNRVEATSAVAIKESFEHAASVAHESFANLKTVKAFTLEHMFAQRFNEATDTTYQAATKAGFWSGFSLGLHWGLMFTSFGLGFWWGVKKVAADLERDPYNCLPIFQADDENVTDSDQCFTGGIVISVFWCIVGAAFFLSKATPSLGVLAQARNAVDEILSLYTRPSQTDLDGLQEDGDKECEDVLVFDRLKFAYPARPLRSVLNGVSFKIKRGQTVAIVGASGSGKSTIVQLIERFYEPDTGEIFVNGINIKDYNVQLHRSRIALVSQEPRLFADTVAANIGCGREGCSREDIIKAAKEANAHDFIMNLQDGYDTWVGDGGSQVSGGQKQRIAIARALVRNPMILILDEATSALDNQSEKVVQETINEVLKDSQRTIIIIAHRLTTVRNADKIIVLHNAHGHGAVVAEEGTHDELVAIENGLYSALIGCQSSDAPAPLTRAEATLSLNASIDDVAGSMRNDMSSEVSKVSFDNRHSLLRIASKISASASRLLQIGDDSTGMPLTDIEDLEEKQMIKEMYDRCTRKLREIWYLPVLGILAATLAGLVWPIFGISFAYFINIFAYWIPDEMREDSVKWAGGFVGLGVFAWLTMWFQRWLLDKSAAFMLKALRMEVYEQYMLNQNCDFFDKEENSPGELLNLLSNEILYLKAWAGETIAVYIQSATTLLMGLILALVSSWKLGLVAFSCVLIMAPVSYYNSVLMRNGGFQYSTNNAELKTASPNEILMEVILNIRTVIAYNMQSVMSERFKKAILIEYEHGKKAALLTGIAWGLSQSLTLLTFTLCMYYGFILVDAKEADGRQMVQAILCLLLSALNMGRAFSSATNSSKAKEAAKKLARICRTPRKIDEYSDAGAILTSIDDIKFTDVDFIYEQRPETLVLGNLSFLAPKGKVTALVGPSGCGKSTVLQLLERFYDVTRGAIELNGRTLREYNVQSLRSRIGVVSQEPVLFWGSVEDNIAYGKPGATIEEIVTAAEQANAMTFINELPEKLQTDVGRGGSKLSGGQKQRVAIARALVRKPDLLILDEATSALDAESEKVTQQALTKLMESKSQTTLVVAHRLSTIRNADQIIVFGSAQTRGESVMEVGTHEELMKRPRGIYRGLVRIAENH